MAIIVQKYGGTSLAGPDEIKRVARRIVKTAASANSVCAVVSAMGASTRQDPFSVRVGDISGTEICPLAKNVRKRGKDYAHSLGGRPVNLDLVDPTVYSQTVRTKSGASLRSLHIDACFALRWCFLHRVYRCVTDIEHTSIKFKY